MIALIEERKGNNQELIWWERQKEELTKKHGDAKKVKNCQTGGRLKEIGKKKQEGEETC